MNRLPRKYYPRKFKNGTVVLLTEDYVARPKFSEQYQLRAGQSFTVIGQGYWEIYESADYDCAPSEPWVRCKGIRPATGEPYFFDFAIDTDVLIEATEANRLLYAILL